MPTPTGHPRYLALNRALCDIYFSPINENATSEDEGEKLTDEITRLHRVAFDSATAILGRGVDPTPDEFFAARGFSLAFRTLNTGALDAEYERVRRDHGHRQRQVERWRRDGMFGPVWADLVRGGSVVQPGYGTGDDQDAAARAAVIRWKAEQGD